MKILYGTDRNKIDITDRCYTHHCDGDVITIPSDDAYRSTIFTDPVYGVVKKIYVDLCDDGDYHHVYQNETAYINIIHKTIRKRILVTHDRGFFSCCSIRLYEVVKHLNRYKSLPCILDSSKQFSAYKTDPSIDVTFDYFEHYDNIHINHDCKTTIDYYWYIQFSDYHRLQFEELTPLMTKYYSPSGTIKKIIQEIESIYEIDYNNVCVLFYKSSSHCGYDEYIKKGKIILQENPSVTFLIHSDITKFIEAMVSEFPNNSFYLKEYHPMVITIIMSRCNYIVCGSNNWSLFTLLYRGHCKNVYQILENIDFEKEKYCIHSFLSTHGAGLGDCIRGTIALYNFSKLYGYKLYIDCHHPIFKYMKPNAFVISKTDTEYIEFYPPMSYHDIFYNLHNLFKSGKSLCIKTNSQYIDNKNNIFGNYGQISDECKGLLRSIMCLNSEAEEKLKNVFHTVYKMNMTDRFKIFHFRFGDDYLVNKKNEKDPCYEAHCNNIIHTMNKNKDGKFILMTDSSEMGRQIKKDIPGIYYWDNCKTHLGFNINNDDESILNTLLEFFIISKSTEIFSPGSGFSKSVSLIFDIPYTILSHGSWSHLADWYKSLPGEQ